MLAACMKEKLGRAESSKYLYCLGLASGGGWVFAMVVTRWLYGGHVPWGTAAAMPGLIGGAAILFVSAKAFHVPLREYLELTIPYHLLHARLGALGLLHGGVLPSAHRPTASLACNSPPKARRANCYGVQPVHPTQLYEMGLLIVLGLATQFKVPPLHRFGFT